MTETQGLSNFPTIGRAGPDGLFFICHFDAAGYKCAAEDAAWTWRSYHLTDLAARQAIANDPSMPTDARQAFLSSGSDCLVDYADGWLFGDLPDLRHDYAVEARGLGHFRFAFNETTLIGARKQPLDSVEYVRKLIETRARAYKSPQELVGAVMTYSLEGMAGQFSALGLQLDSIEDRVVRDAWHSERQTLAEARRQLVVMHRQMTTLTGLFRHLDHAHRDELPDAFAAMAERLSHRSFALHHDGEQLQARARLLQDEMMALLTAQSNRLLYVLSVMTAVLLPMTIISGLFGMNVGGIPFGENPAGFWIVSGLSVAVAATTLYFVKRLGDRA